MKKIELYGSENEVYNKIASLGLNNVCDAEQIIRFLKYNDDLVSRNMFKKVGDFYKYQW